ncbi:hypothetical protein SSTU70S_07098 [Stutzerimonas stutzeri]
MLEPYLLDGDGKPDAQWVALVERHPTRFVLGSDVVGHFDNLWTARGWRRSRHFSMR